MKKQLLTILATTLTSIALSQSIPNGGFENWNTTTVENPQFFMCSNDENKGGGYGPANAVKTTDSYSNSYAIRITSILNGTDTIGGWFADGNPGQNMTGGIPYSQTPTGIRLYYKSNIMLGDSALVLAIFKKAGITIGQYIYKISGSQSSYTLFSKTFSPALSQAPDSIIFACAASNLMSTKGIPGSMLQVDSISFTGVSSQPINFNGDMELWQNDTRSNVIGWSTENAIQTTNKYSGSYALELTTNPPSFGDNQIRVGRCTNGTNVNGGPPVGGSPYSTQVDTLVFYYKYLPANYPLSTDSARVSITFSNNGVSIWGTQYLLGYSGSYKKKQIPFNLGLAPDSVIISMESSNWPVVNSFVGSDLKIDQLYFKSQTIPISDFIIPATGCKGVPIQFTDNSANMPTSWQWFMTTGSPSNSTLQNPIVTYNSTGTFTVSLQAADSFGTGAFMSKTITIYNNPVITATSATVCPGNTATLNASGASTYTWNMNGTGSTYTVSPTVSTTYTVVGTSTVGCSGSTTASVFVPIAATPSICMATVDSTSTDNIVYWDKTTYTNVDSFIIYREVSTNTYTRIAGVSKDSLSLYRDVARSIGPANGDPNIGSYRYKLQIRDTCGNYGALSLYHNTVKITDQQNGTFSWNTYDVEGQSTPVANFILERDNANTNVWVTVGTVSGTQTSLFDGSYGTFQTIANWRVNATGFNCTPTSRFGNNNTQTVIIKSKSNITNNRTTGISSNNTVLGIYPNPSNGIITITLAVANATADVYDLTGKKVASFTLQNTSSQIDLSNLSNGSYFLNVNTVNGVYHKKINKAN